MDTNALKKFAQEARRELLEQVEARLEQVLHTDSVELREKLGVVNELRAQLEKKTKENLIEEVAYTWFNRFCALRYMDVNHITKVGVVSPMPNFTQPEILQEAKQGIFDKDWQLDRFRVRGLLDGSIPSSNPEQEAYRLLLVAVCNSYADEMDFLFPRIEDYTELLMPEDLLSTQSVLHSVREALTEEVCEDVEVIGWLYQFYISEKKDEVMGQKGNIAKEDIPAVTQLFTPHWIVRYMVENSLGRLWLLNHPGSKIRNQMEYYIEPEQKESNPPLPQAELPQATSAKRKGSREAYGGEGGGEGEESFLKVVSPEELKILDPACGSGHILIYAFDLLYAIYEEMGYDPISIPQLILENNLYGIEIDKRAAMLSSFALMMKAVERDKRFFTREVQPNILEMEDVRFDPKEVKAYMAKVGEELWTQELWEGFQQFENAKTFGSLIRPELKCVPELRERMKAKGVFEDLFLSKTNEKVQKVLKMSEYLSPRYHVVVANPPFMSSRSQNINLKNFSKSNFPRTKHDLYSMFIERSLTLLQKEGFLGLMTPFTWMNIKSYEMLRENLINKHTIISLIKPEYHSFFESAFVPLCTFILSEQQISNHIGTYIDLSDYNGAKIQPQMVKKAINADLKVDYVYQIEQKEFLKIPSYQIAFELNERLRKVFEIGQPLERIAKPKKGLSTGKNSKFLRMWFEVEKCKLSFINGSTWFPMTKGGGFRKWYGNFLDIIIWADNGKSVKEYDGSVIRNEQYYLQEGVTWNYVSLASFGSRYVPKGFINNAAGPIIYTDSLFYVMAILNTSVAKRILSIISPTMTFEVGTISSFPIIIDKSIDEELIQILVEIGKKDWDNYEVSWDFKMSPILQNKSIPLELPIKQLFLNLQAEWDQMIDEMRKLEEKNNSFFINAYGLENELDPTVPIKEITLNCNPCFRFNEENLNQNLGLRLLEDTMKEFISYAVGCMFGRYSLDKPGLILANQGETVEDYYKTLDLLPLPRAEWLPATSAKCKGSRESHEGEGWGEGSITFPPTETNVIPILEGEWFADDILAQFKRFFKVTFGEENFAENLRFIEDALDKDLQKYFTRDFYKDHVQMYKKCPIYWLFSSPNGSFNALIYMHRYTPETVSVVLNQYLREYRDKLTAHRTNLERISTNASAHEKSKALKEIEDITKILAELKEYEDEVLYPLASQQIQIDLDDGVKVNYAKFRNALKKI